MVCFADNFRLFLKGAESALLLPAVQLIVHYDQSCISNPPTHRSRRTVWLGLGPAFALDAGAQLCRKFTVGTSADPPPVSWADNDRCVGYALPDFFSDRIQI